MSKDQVSHCAIRGDHRTACKCTVVSLTNTHTHTPITCVPRGWCLCTAATGAVSQGPSPKKKKKALAADDTDGGEYACVILA
jgi:hypothetical protein